MDTIFRAGCFRGKQMFCIGHIILYQFLMSQKDFWVSVLRRIKPTIKKANFITWFQNTAAFSIEDGILVVGVPTAFAKTWLMDKFDLKILQAAQEIDSSIQKINYEVSGKLVEEGNVSAVNVKNLFASEDDKKVRKVRNLNEVSVEKGKGGQKIVSQMMNRKYTLSNFIVGGDNRLPHAACQAVSNMPGGIYNPLYIYGSVGLGKTHLLQAVGNEILKNFPDMVVKYITAERFVTEVVEAISKRHMQSFKDKYRKVDCLLIDDVQFFARKNSSQQEFFHTFNELYDSNKQIVLTSDRAPSELDDLDERLKSRFGMGMVTELLMPDFETKLAILSQKCSEYGVILDPEVSYFVASNIHSSVRELEGVLKQIVADMQIFDRVATIRSVAEIIKRMNKAQEIIGYDVDNRKGKTVVRDVMEVINIVARYYNVTTEQLVGKDRHKGVMLPRHVSMYLIKNELGESYEKIGMGFGGRNHTTVIHACNKTTERLKKDLRLVRDINAIKSEMGL
jgi:chromosomal replication initiator protein